MTEIVSEAPPVEPDPDQPEQPEPDTAEQPEPDSDEPEQGEAEAEPEPAPAPAQTPDFEAQRKVMNGFTKRAEKLVGDIQAEFGELVHLCPRCLDPLPGVVFDESMVPLTADKLAQVKLSIGQGAEPDYKQSEAATTCPKCEGWGQVLTGSKVRGADRVKCLECNGRGWIGPLAHQLTQVGETAATVEANGTQPEPEETHDRDPWGRVRGDPDFGILPGYENR